MSDWDWDERPWPDLWPHSDLPVREHTTSDGTTTFITDGDYDGELVSYYPWIFAATGYLATTLGGYDRARLKGKSTHHTKWLYLQQLVMGPTPAGHIISFINGNKLDARSANLEFITPSNQAAKRQIGNGNKGSNPTGYVGVHDLATGKRRAQYLAHPTWKRYQVVAARKSHKVYATAEEAARAYDAAALRLYGKYAQLNFPREH